jgi:DNA end-binding protein Ku
MAARSFWTGYLKLSLVTCPVAMMPATTQSEKVRFHTLSRDTHERLVSQYVDAQTGESVPDENEVKGYEVAPDSYVMLEDEELDAVALDSTRAIDIETFVPRESVPWIWYDRPHYLTPDDKVGEEAFVVIKEAMAATGMVGIARLVLYRRERAVLLEPCGRGIILWTLRYGDEVRDPTPCFPNEPQAPSPAALNLVRKLIDGQTKPWSPELVRDPVQDKLVEIIEAKKKGRKPARPVETGAPSPVVLNVMDALRRSLATERQGMGRQGTGQRATASRTTRKAASRATKNR